MTSQCRTLCSAVVIVITCFSQANSNQESYKTELLRRNLQSFEKDGYYLHHRQVRGSGRDDESDTLRMTLIIVFTVAVTIGLLLTMTICAVCMLRRARYGAFCCMKPKLRRYPQSLHFESDNTEEEADSEQPPQYDTSYLTNESPPVYEDALQDVVIAKGVDMSTVSLPSYSSNESRSTPPRDQLQQHGPHPEITDHEDHQQSRTSCHTSVQEVHYHIDSDSACT